MYNFILISITGILFFKVNRKQILLIFINTKAQQKLEDTFQLAERIKKLYAKMIENLTYCQNVIVKYYNAKHKL